MLAAQKWSTGAWVSSSGKDPLPPVTTVILLVAQFIACHKPFVADFNVPTAVRGSNKTRAQ
jgi:hypothetical protein